MRRRTFSRTARNRKKWSIGFGKPRQIQHFLPPFVSFLRYFGPFLPFAWHTFAMLFVIALLVIALIAFCLVSVFIGTWGRSVAARLQHRSTQTTLNVQTVNEEGLGEAIDIDCSPITNPVPSTSRAHAQIDCNAGLLGILNRLDRLSETVEAMRTYQFSLLTTQKLNEWDISHCHSAIFLHDELIAEHASQQKYFVSLRALVPARCTYGIFYFEISVFKMKSDFGIGLAPHWMGMHEIVGHTENSFAYWSDGTIHGCCDSLSSPLDGYAQYGEGDVVGCGIDLFNRRIFFTINGTRLETGNLYADPIHLFGCCTLVDFEDRIQANFGPNFQYELSNLVPF